MAVFDKLRELDLTKDEVEKIGDAFKKPEFRKLFAEYVDEIQDPKNRQIYEDEIKQLEKQRGIDATFIHPKPGYVIKTSLNGSEKCFINICVNELIQKPSSSPTVKDGSRGLQWSLPHSLSPVREDLDNKNLRCKVYDVVFHPDTLHLASNNKAFRNMVNSTALEAIESNFDVQLDKKNLKFPKLQYKGMPHACVIRNKCENPPETTPEDREFLEKLYANAQNYSTSPKKSKKPKKPSTDDSKSAYTTPKYTIKHRTHVDMQEFTEHRESKMNVAIPKELIVEVNLPLLKSSGDINLDVTDKTLQLVSENPKYKLNLTLPYTVVEANGNAKFDKDLKKLIITLPVKRNTKFLLTDCSIEDSGVESGHGSPNYVESEDEISENKLISEVKPSENVETKFRTKFLDENLCYNIPEFTCHIYENILAFTLNVKNVDENSICKLYNDAGSSVHIKFTSIGASFYPTHYAFYVQLSKQQLIPEVSIETWDNNVIVQIPFSKNNIVLKSYKYGIEESNLTEKYLEEPAFINAVLQEKSPSETKPDTPKKVTEKRDSVESVESNSSNSSDDVINRKPVHLKPKTKAIDIMSSYESSGDELSCCSYSPSKGAKGILKRKNRFSVRSISESSLDDIVYSSFENCHVSLDSVIPEEEGDVSSSLKKTVRFNDNVTRQLFRSNSSILGQKKKNQRKARNKKRAHDRRHSESELSEVEEKMEGDTKTLKDGGGKIGNGKESQNDIFHLDMYN